MRRGEDIDPDLREYAVMGRRDAYREVRALNRAMKKARAGLKNLYTQEVMQNPVAQTYLYLPFDYKHRYYKIWLSKTLTFKLVLVATLSCNATNVHLINRSLDRSPP